MAARPLLPFLEHARYPDAPRIVVSNDTRDFKLVYSRDPVHPIEATLVDIGDQLPDIDWSVITRGQQRFKPSLGIREYHPLFAMKIFMEGLGSRMNMRLINWNFFSGIERYEDNLVPMTMFTHLDNIPNDQLLVSINIEGEGALFPIGDPQSNHKHLNRIKQKVINEPGIGFERTVETLAEFQRLCKKTGIRYNSVPEKHARAFGNRQWHNTPVAPSRLSVTGHYVPQ